VDVALLRRVHAIGDRSLDLLDADSSWALVFADDAAAVYVRRTPNAEALIRQFGYAVVPGGTARLASFERMFDDDRVRPLLRLELDRMIAGSPVNSTATSLRAYFHMFEGRIAEAERDLERAHAVDPLVPRYYERLGRIAMVRGQPRRALALFEKQQREERVPEVDLEMAKLHQVAGDRGAAIRAYRRAARDASLQLEAEDSLRVLGARR
jgi:tetratricopeptide (TPR) repeat protein